MSALNAKQSKRLKSIGLTADTEEEARKKLIKFLAKNEVEGVDDEDLSSLLEMAEVFKSEDDEDEAEEPEEEQPAKKPASKKKAPEPEPEDEEESEDDEDEEEEAPAPKKTVKKAAKKPEPEPEEEDEDEDEEGEDESAEEDDEEEEAPAPKKTVAKKPAPSKKKVADTEQEYDDLSEEVEKSAVSFKKKSNPVVTKEKPGGKKGKDTTSSKPVKFYPRDIKEHGVIGKRVAKLFEDLGFVVDILKQGFTIRVAGKNSKVTIFNYDEVLVQPDGTLVGNMYMNRFKTVEDVDPFIPEELADYECGLYRSGYMPSLRKLEEDKIETMLQSGILEESMRRVTKTDVKMGKNREKLEETLSKAKPDKKAAAEAPAKSKKPAPEPEEEDEDEEAAPAKKTTVVKKKTTKAPEPEPEDDEEEDEEEAPAPKKTTVVKKKVVKK